MLKSVQRGRYREPGHYLRTRMTAQHDGALEVGKEELCGLVQRVHRVKPLPAYAPLLANHARAYHRRTAALLPPAKSRTSTYRLPPTADNPRSTSAVYGVSIQMVVCTQVAYV